MKGDIVSSPVKHTQHQCEGYRMEQKDQHNGGYMKSDLLQIQPVPARVPEQRERDADQQNAPAEDRPCLQKFHSPASVIWHLDYWIWLFVRL